MGAEWNFQEPDGAGGPTNIGGGEHHQTGKNSNDNGYILAYHRLGRNTYLI